MYAGDKFGGIWLLPTSRLGVDGFLYPFVMHQFDLLCHHHGLHGSCGKTKGKCFGLAGLTWDVKTQVLPGLVLDRYVEAGILEIYGCDSFLCLIVSGVSILNDSVFRNLFRVLRFKIGLYRLMDFGTRKSLL